VTCERYERFSTVIGKKGLNLTEQTEVAHSLAVSPHTELPATSGSREISSINFLGSLENPQQMDKCFERPKDS
jgi:hypothetical protein